MHRRDAAQRAPEAKKPQNGKEPQMEFQVPLNPPHQIHSPFCSILHSLGNQQRILMLTPNKLQIRRISQICRITPFCKILHSYLSFYRLWEARIPPTMMLQMVPLLLCFPS